MDASGLSFVFLIAMIAIFYFMIIRPQKKRDKEIKEMRASLKRGDEILSIGGIYGEVIKVNEEIVIIELEHSKQRIKLAKWGVREVVNPSSKGKVEEIEENNDSKDDKKE